MVQAAYATKSTAQTEATRSSTSDSRPSCIPKEISFDVGNDSDNQSVVSNLESVGSLFSEVASKASASKRAASHQSASQAKSDNHDFDGSKAGKQSAQATPTASFMKTFAGYAAGAAVQCLILGATSALYRATSGVPILNTVLPIAIGSLVDNMVAARMQSSQARGINLSTFSQGMQMVSQNYHELSQSRLQGAMQGA